MPSRDKLLARMRSNPRDWRIEDLESLARHFGLSVRKPGGSHVIFFHPAGTRASNTVRRAMRWHDFGSGREARPAA